MTITTTLVFDAIHANIGRLPKGHAAGYTTGSPDIRWTAADWAAHPGAVRICQDPGATDHTADILDVEGGAATIADCGPWVLLASANFHSGTRPGQRSPAIYCSRSNVAPVVNALTAHGIKKDIALWIADWNNNEAEATAEVVNATGPLPVIGRQFRNAGPYDVSVFSVPWLTNVSKAPAPKPPVPPGQWNDPHAWTWAEVEVVGTGLDGKHHAFTLNGGKWVKVA